MSLTRKEWEQMWESIKRIEKYNTSMQLNATKRINIELETNKIKKQIQQVIGQIE